MSQEFPSAESSGELSFTKGTASIVSQTSHDVDSHQPLSLTVIEAVEAATDAQTTELPPLYEVIDPDALDSLFQSTSEESVCVEFSYSGVEVAVQGDGTVTVMDSRDA